MKDVISLHSIYTDNNKVINKQIGKQSSIHLPTFHCKKHSSTSRRWCLLFIKQKEITNQFIIPFLHACKVVPRMKSVARFSHSFTACKA